MDGIILILVGLDWFSVLLLFPGLKGNPELIEEFPWGKWQKTDILAFSGGIEPGNDHTHQPVPLFQPDMDLALMRTKSE